MADFLLGFYGPLAAAEQSLGGEWQPPGHPAETPWEDVWDAWLAHETEHLGDIYEAARQLVREGNLSRFDHPVVYFLSLRHKAALRHVQMSYAWRDQRPVSLIPFPVMSPSALAEWLLTDWGDGRALQHTFPEEAAP